MLDAGLYDAVVVPPTVVRAGSRYVAVAGFWTVPAIDARRDVDGEGDGDGAASGDRELTPTRRGRAPPRDSPRRRVWRLLPRVTTPVEAKVNPIGRTSDSETCCAPSLPAEFPTAIVYVAVVPDGVFVTLAVDVVFVTVS